MVNRYYCLPGSNVNISCDKVDQQVIDWLKGIHIPPEHIAEMRKTYTAEIENAHIGNVEAIEHVESRLDALEQRDIRMVRLASLGRIKEESWDHVFDEIQKERWDLEYQLRLLQQENQTMIDNLNAAFDIFHRFTQLYDKLMPDEQHKVLTYIIEKVVVDRDGIVLRVECHPPFQYLLSKYDEVKKRRGDKGIKNTTPENGCGVQDNLCSEHVRESWETWIRTRTDGTRIHSSAVKLSPTDTVYYKKVVSVCKAIL